MIKSRRTKNIAAVAWEASSCTHYEKTLRAKEPITA
jgi:hypothetical protein